MNENMGGIIFEMGAGAYPLFRIQCFSWFSNNNAYKLPRQPLNNRVGRLDSPLIVLAYSYSYSNITCSPLSIL